MASPSKSKVCFFSDDRTATLQNRTELKKFIESLFKKEGKVLEALNYIFCSDQKLLEINQQYLAHDYFTDIVTFELSSKGSPIVGEVYISLDRVRENSTNLSVSFKSELHRVIFHGALHLCGFKDKSKLETQTMREKEATYLRNYGIDVP